MTLGPLPAVVVESTVLVRGAQVSESTRHLDADFPRLLLVHSERLLEDKLTLLQQGKVPEREEEY